MTPEKPQQHQDSTVNPVEGARRLMASLESEIQSGEDALARTLHEGHDHFRDGMARAASSLEDANLDGWTHQAAAMARIGSAAGRTPAPAQGGDQEDS